MVSFTLNSGKSAWSATGSDPKGKPMNNDLGKGVSNLQNITSNVTGSVRLSEGNIPNIPEIGLQDGGEAKWLPICGENFTDNNYGASLFCQKLDSKYTYGLIVKTHIHYLPSVEEDAESKGIEVGTCLKDDEDLFSCSGKGKECDTFAKGTVDIKCFEGKAPW